MSGLERFLARQIFEPEFGGGSKAITSTGFPKSNGDSGRPLLLAGFPLPR